MTKQDIWIISTKSRPFDNSTFDTDGSEFYFVECLIPTDSEASARKEIPHLLRDKHMDLAEILACKAYNPDDWKNEIQFDQIASAAKFAKQNNLPKFALFISSEAMDFEDKDEDSDRDLM